MTAIPPRPHSTADELAARMADLMGRYCDGERRAFDEIYAELAPRVLGYLVGLVKDRAAAEDLLQIAFVKLHQYRAIYVRGANPVPWLYTIAHRTCLDEMRRRKRARVRVSADGDLGMAPAVGLTGSSASGAQLGLAGQPAGAFGFGFGPGEGSATDSEVDEAAMTRAMAALESLPDTQRQAVLLTKIQGHSTADAATILGTTAGAIKLRVHRGYLALRDKLKHLEDDGRAAVGPIEIAQEHAQP
jgi:RNA polymerase sigma-70 factor (ECF subfamily)